jgi:hypothetical protein
MPAPLNAGQQQDVFSNGENQVPESEHRRQPPETTNPNHVENSSNQHSPDDFVLFLEHKLTDGGDVGGVEGPAGEETNKVLEVVTRLVRGGDNIQGTIVVLVVVNGVATGKRRGKDSIKQTNPPVERVSEEEVNNRVAEKSQSAMSLLMAKGVAVRKIHKIGANSENVVSHTQPNTKPMLEGVVETEEEEEGNHSSEEHDDVDNEAVFDALGEQRGDWVCDFVVNTGEGHNQSILGPSLTKSVNEIPKDSQANNRSNNGDENKQHDVPNNKSKGVIDGDGTVSVDNPLCVFLFGSLRALLSPRWDQIGNHQIDKEKNDPSSKKRGDDFWEVLG